MTDSVPCIRRAFDSLDAMRKEYQGNLRAGGAFCPGVSGFAERTPCTLVLIHPVSQSVLELKAEVVFVKPDPPGMGVGLHLVEFGPAIQRQLTEFIEAAGVTSPTTETVQEQGPAPDERLDSEADPSNPKLAVSALHDRLRAMSLAAQLKLAREGGMTERVALERLFGKSVWEALLQNQRITPPEVARIARMGTASSSMIDTISSNAAWLQSGEVRRALLSNPRLSEEGVMRVLRHMSKPELRLICNQTNYQPRVRTVARMLVGKG